jgi:hypothetical protein
MQRAAFLKTWTIQYLPCKELLFSKPGPYSVFHAKSCFSQNLDHTVSSMQRAAFLKTWTIQYLPCKELLFSKPGPYSVFHAKSCFSQNLDDTVSSMQRVAFKQKGQDFAMQVRVNQHPR